MTNQPCPWCIPGIDNCHCTQEEIEAHYGILLQADLARQGKLTWITNHPKSIKGLWPRRIGVDYIEGKPMGTHAYSSDELAQSGLIGVYVDMPMEQYRQLPLAKTPKDMPK